MIKFIKKEPDISYIGKPELVAGRTSHSGGGEKKVKFCTVDRSEQIGGIDQVI